jgi:hypothetical protein
MKKGRNKKGRESTKKIFQKGARSGQRNARRRKREKYYQKNGYSVKKWKA